MIDEMVQYNREFVAARRYQSYQTDQSRPRKKTAVVACMDTRLVELLPAALGVKNGDIKLIKNAGGVIYQPYGDTVRSLLIAVYCLGVEHIMVIGHTDCGVQSVSGPSMKELMSARGIPEETLRELEDQGVDFDRWLSGFTRVEEGVRKSVELLRNHPLLPQEISMAGFVMNSITGELTAVH